MAVIFKPGLPGNGDKGAFVYCNVRNRSIIIGHVTKQQPSNVDVLLLHPFPPLLFLPNNVPSFVVDVVDVVNMHRRFVR